MKLTSFCYAGASEIEKRSTSSLRWRSLPVFVVPPAYHPPIRPHPTGIAIACADRMERTFRWSRFTVFVRIPHTPADRLPVCTHRASVMRVANADRYKRPAWWCDVPISIVSIVSPTNSGAIGSQPAGMVVTGTDRLESAWGRRGILVLTTPANQCAICPNAAGVTIPSYADGFERPAGRRSFRSWRTIIVMSKSPANHCPVGLHSTGVVICSTHRLECSTRRKRFAVIVISPTDYGVIRPHATCVTPSDAK